MNEAAIYARLSKDGGDDSPIARQEGDSREWATSNGLAVERVFCDMLSGYKDLARPEFDAAMTGPPGAVAARSRCGRQGEGGPPGVGRASPQGLLLQAGRLRLCGTGMVMTHNGNSYACSLTMSGGDCPRVTVSVKAADAYVREAMLRRLAAMDPEVPEDLTVLEAVARTRHGERPEDARSKAERAALQAELEDVEARLDDLVAQRDAPEFRGDRGRQRYERERDRLLGRVEAVGQALQAIPPALPSIAPLLDPVELRESWPNLDPNIKRAAVAAALVRVEVRKAAKPGGRFDGDARFGITWRQYAAEDTAPAEAEEDTAA